MRSIAILVLFALIGFSCWLGAINLWAWHNYTAAREAIQTGAYRQAENYLERCLAVWSGNGQVHFWMARTQRCLGNFDKARQHLHKSEELHWPNEGIELETILLRAQQGEFAEVESTLIHLAQTETEDTPAVLEVLADAYVKYEHLAAAFFWGKRLLKHSPDNVTALLAVAHIHEVSNHHEEALQQYRRAVDLQPDNDRAREALARALLTFHEPQQAIVHFQELRSRGDESQAVLLGLARCYRSLGRPKEARALLDRLAADYPKVAEVWAERGKLALQQADLIDAERCLRQSLALYRYDPATLYNLYQCLRRKGNARRAEAEKLHARHRRLVNDTNRLRTLMTQETVKDPTNPKLAFETATLLQRLGEGQAAVHWLHKTLQLHPAHDGARKALIAYYDKIRNPGLAAKFR